MNNINEHRRKAVGMHKDASKFLFSEKGVKVGYSTQPPPRHDKIVPISGMTGDPSGLENPWGDHSSLVDPLVSPSVGRAERGSNAWVDSFWVNLSLQK